jgi:hypothetical protein
VNGFRVIIAEPGDLFIANLYGRFILTIIDDVDGENVEIIFGDFRTKTHHLNGFGITKLCAIPQLGEHIGESWESIEAALQTLGRYAK